MIGRERVRERENVYEHERETERSEENYRLG